MEKLKRAVIKEEFVEITGDFIKAVLLQQFIYWSERVRDFDVFIKQENERLHKDDADSIPLTNGWIYKKSEELSEETMLGLKPNTIRNHISALVKMGFIDERRNPDAKWDRTMQYRVNLKNIADALAEKGYALSDYTSKYQHSLNENANSKNEVRESKNDIQESKKENRTVENCGTISEITTKTTSETITEGNNVLGKSPKTSSRFTPPTLEEVEDYCIERNNNVDPERFIDYYTSNGWMVGKNKMKDWKAAVRTWEKTSKAEKNERKSGNVFLDIAKDEGLF